METDPNSIMPWVEPGQHCLHQGNGCLEVLHHPDNRKPFLKVEHRQLQSRLTSWITAFNAGRSKTIFKRTQWCGSYSILCISCMYIFRCSSTVWISFINTMFPHPHSLLRSTKVSQLQILSTRANQTFGIIFPHTPVKCRFNQIFIFPNCQLFSKPFFQNLSKLFKNHSWGGLCARLLHRRALLSKSVF